MTWLGTDSLCFSSFWSHVFDGERISFSDVFAFCWKLRETSLSWLIEEGRADVISSSLEVFTWLSPRIGESRLKDGSNGAVSWKRPPDKRLEAWEVKFFFSREISTPSWAGEAIQIFDRWNNIPRLSLRDFWAVFRDCFTSIPSLVESGPLKDMLLFLPFPAWLVLKIGTFQFIRRRPGVDGPSSSPRLGVIRKRRFLSLFTDAGDEVTRSLELEAVPE